MRWCTSGWVMLAAGLVCCVGCAAAGPAGEVDESAGGGAEAAASQREAQVQRASVSHMIESLPGVSRVQVAVGAAPGGGAAEHVTVTVYRGDGETIDDALAQRIVDHVVERFRDVPPTNVAVRDGADPAYLYLGDLGRME